MHQVNCFLLYDSNCACLCSKREPNPVNELVYIDEENKIHPVNETIINAHTSYPIKYSDHEGLLIIIYRPCNFYN